VDVRSQNAKKFMNMFNKGEIPEGVSSADRQEAHSVPKCRLYWCLIEFTD
jgi:hypothetical protein